MAVSADELPSEGIFEILSRTSLESLEQCKAVSKSWKQIIYEPTFLPLHCQRTNSLFGYFFQGVKCYKYPSALATTSAAAAIKETWPSDDMKILASSDQGILCCERQIRYNKRYYSCKPATAQWQALPNPKLRYKTAAVAIVVIQPRPLRYIIVRLYKYICSTFPLILQYKCEIFHSKTWDRWEKIECGAAPHDEIINPCDAAVTTGNRAVHWLTNEDNIITVDVKKRRLLCAPLSETVRCNAAYKWKNLVEYEGKLGFIGLVEDGDRSDMELWVEGDRKMVVDMRMFGKCLGHVQPVEFCNNGVVFMRTNDRGAFYNLQNHSFTQVDVPYELRNPKQIFRFWSDFEIVDLKSGRTSKPNCPTTDKHVSCGLARMTSLVMLSLFVGSFLVYFDSYF